jgi:hypothetical protein
MLKHLHALRRLGAPFMVAVLLFLLTAAPVALAHTRLTASSVIGPKKYYLALGDSLAFGYQPNFDFSHGYADYFFNNLKTHGTSSLANMGCPGETSSTFINGKCPYAFLRKYPYIGAQLNAAVSYLKAHAGQVSPVTLDIGANDLLPDINLKTCAISSTFNADLTTLDNNLTQSILPQLRTAMTVKGQFTGDLVMMNYYDPYQNVCPNTVTYIQTINTHLSNDLGGGPGLIVDVFTAFGGATTPNPHICSYTWMCSIFKDIHATRTGYSVIATTFENGVGY